MLGNFKMLSGKSQEFQLLIFVETQGSVSPADSTSYSLNEKIRVRYEKIRVGTNLL